MPKKKVILTGSPIPFETAKSLAKPLRGPAEKIMIFMPYLKLRLLQAEMDVDARDFVSVSLLLSIITGVFAGLFTFFMGRVSGAILAGLLVPVFIAIVAFSLQFIYYINIPTLAINRKIKGIERNLIFSMRNLLIQVSSGVPLYTAFAAIANSKYGLVSAEFKKATEKISTGTAQEVALNDLTLGNPSIFFRRAIWQITNGMRAGSNISNVLESAIEALSREQSIQIKRYGSQLNPLSLVYMMVSVVVPSLGMTFFIVLSSFPSIEIGTYMFWIFLAVLAVIQFLILGLIKSRRPNLLE